MEFRTVIEEDNEDVDPHKERGENKRLKEIVEESGLTSLSKFVTGKL
jgi:hypothetical protein